MAMAGDEEFVARESPESGVFIWCAEENCRDEVEEGVSDCHCCYENQEVGGREWVVGGRG